MKYTKEHWLEFNRLQSHGLSGAAALRELGIPRGSLGTLRVRFDGADSVVPLPDEPIVPSESIPTFGPDDNWGLGELAQLLNDYTESLLDLATQMSELTKHAQGLALLDETLVQLEKKNHEASGLRRRLGEAEKRLISRASVVHSND
jgi:hypothetical protein